MKDKAPQQTISRSWLSRIKQALLPQPKNQKQLTRLLRDAEQHNLLNADTLAMIEATLQFAEMQVRDIMIPRHQMVVVKEKQALTSLLTTVVDSGHSRFPAISETSDEVIGILHAKDLLQYKASDPDKFDLTEILRPAVVVPESKHLDVLLKEFRTNRNHMAIVVDEYGGIAGFVTIEDILEQIVGDIEDEFDIDEDAFVKKHSDMRYIIKAHMPIEEFNEYFHESLDPQEFDTIGGLVTNAFGYLPKRGETVKIKRYVFKVLNCDNRRIRLLQAILSRKEVKINHE